MTVRQVRELRPCPWVKDGPSEHCASDDLGYRHDDRCDGCAAPEYPGSRWVAVGTLVEADAEMLRHWNGEEWAESEMLCTRTLYVLEPDDRAALADAVTSDPAWRAGLAESAALRDSGDIDYWNGEGL